MTSSPAGTLKDTISQALPPSFDCRLRYLHTPPKRCDALFSPPPGLEPEKTRLSSHFLTVSIDSKDGESDGDLLVLGIEALVYHTKHLTTIFVSKADSTGYLPQQRPSPIRQIATAFLRWLSAKERQKYPKRELVISLFARSQSQYLFPGSAENGRKHILDDRQLIKWWARVLDPLFPTTANGLDYHGYITVPGYEGMEVRPFFPPGTQIGKRWHSGNPLLDLAQSRGIAKDAPPRCLLPRFPDDPKARFMTDLDDEVGLSEDNLSSPSKRGKGKWKAIWNLDRFWEAMEFRQECSSGRMVGFIWLVVRDPAAKRTQEDAQRNGEAEDDSQDDGAQAAASSQKHDDHFTAKSSSKKQRRKPLTGPIIARQPRLKGGSSSLTGSSGLESMHNVASEDGMVLSKEGYDQAMQILLHLDFATRDVAVQSTSKWTKQVNGIAGSQGDWSIKVTGEAASAAKNASLNGGGQANDLGGLVRKKRKAEASTAGEGQNRTEARVETAISENPPVNMLGAGMIRKKPKPTDT